MIRVTQLERGDHGEWQAFLHFGDAHVRVSRETGSWLVLDGERRFELLPVFAAELQARVRKIERREKASA